MHHAETDCQLPLDYLRLKRRREGEREGERERGKREEGIQYLSAEIAGAGDERRVGRAGRKRESH